MHFASMLRISGKVMQTIQYLVLKKAKLGGIIYMEKTLVTGGI